MKKKLIPRFKFAGSSVVLKKKKENLTSWSDDLGSWTGWQRRRVMEGWWVMYQLFLKGGGSFHLLFWRGAPCPCYRGEHKPEGRENAMTHSKLSCSWLPVSHLMQQPFPGGGFPQASLPSSGPWQHCRMWWVCGGGLGWRANTAKTLYSFSMLQLKPSSLPLPLISEHNVGLNLCFSEQ